MRRHPSLFRPNDWGQSFHLGQTTMRRPTFTLLVLLWTLLLCGLTVALPISLRASDDLIAGDPVLSAGQKIYANQCSQCHGEGGIGNENFYPDPLVGDASIGELTDIIANTMPEEDPDACVADDAGAVAQYIHHAFYSEAAQIRNRPPRQSLQRLTGTQLRQSLTDLYARFSGLRNTTWEKQTTEQGLAASLYNGRGWKKEDRKIDRVDPVVDFDFGTDGPGEGISWDEFHAHWDGGLRVEQTGRYEIIVRSKTSFTMNFGHSSKQLIDNHVQSEGRDEFRRTLLLTGGRVYPIKIDLNQRKRKGDTPPASISLSWIPPGGVETILPASALVPGWSPATLRLSTVMPPDDSSYGFERGISVDAAWDEAVTDASLEFADAMRDELWSDYRNRHKKDEGDRKSKLRDFLTEFVTVAHRGSEDEVAPERIVDPAMESFDDESDIIKAVVLMTLKSPRFLYPSLDNDRSIDRRVANRLSLVLHDSLPTEAWQWDQIQKGTLANEASIRRNAQRMVDDARTRIKVRQMLHHWLELGPEDDLSKDQEKYPGFDAPLIAELRKSLDQFLDQTVWSEPSDFRQLLAADWAFTNQSMADFYGDAWVPMEPDSNDPNVLVRSVSDPTIHVGVLTHPLVMARFSYFASTSPIHRGVFLIRHVMGRTLRPPNAAFAPLSPDLHPSDLGHVVVLHFHVG